VAQEEHLGDDGHPSLFSGMAGAVSLQKAALHPHIPRLGKGAGFRQDRTALPLITAV